MTQNARRCRRARWLLTLSGGSLLALASGACLPDDFWASLVQVAGESAVSDLVGRIVQVLFGTAA
jgi:hypothetical protein